MRAKNRFFTVYVNINGTKEHISYAFTSTHSKARGLAKKYSHKAQNYDFIDLRCHLDDPNMWINKAQPPNTHVCDAYTDRDYREDVLREYWADQ